MRLLPSVLPMVLSLILALSSISMAAMGHGLFPGGAAGSMLVTLCGSDTPVLVELPGTAPDPAGTDHPHCPDCLMHGPVALLPKIGGLPLIRGSAKAPVATWSASPILPPALMQAMARAPPILI